MISIYKVSKEGFKTIFAIDFLEDEASFFFFIDGEWEEDHEKVDTESMEFIYGELVDVNLLKDLDLGEKIELPDGGSITCLANFDNMGNLEENSQHVIEFLDSYAKMMDMV
ncbi:MAG: hypothetical protein Q4P18_08285 [Methanobrevibacter sp.]|uniref:hypothetical protein n=1 Tax=Methanobrevibacter sp. TaxID=66852 RepID=UPI0026E03529|nr:hypothetical protein [Methanobrevibacter sp.]MDO5849520.1 hypothetical protein [Methanobrevibacter sp.]